MGVHSEMPAHSEMPGPTIRAQACKRAAKIAKCEVRRKSARHTINLLINKDELPSIGAQAEALARITRLQLDLALGRGRERQQGGIQSIRKDQTGFELSDSTIKAAPLSGWSSVGNVYPAAPALISTEMNGECIEMAPKTSGRRFPISRPEP